MHQLKRLLICDRRGHRWLHGETRYPWPVQDVCVICKSRHVWPGWQDTPRPVKVV